MSGMVVPMFGQGQGLVSVVGTQQMLDDQKKAAEAMQTSELIVNLAAHVKKCFMTANSAKQQMVEERLLQCVRQRRGEYDPDILAEIRKSAGSEIYMMLSANKCRAASSWIKDVMFGTKGQQPWDVEPTADPSLPPEMAAEIASEAAQEAMRIEMDMAMGQPVMTPEAMKNMVNRIHDLRVSMVKDKATQRMDRMRNKMQDQLQEGSYYDAMDAFIDDLVTFPYAVIKGPVVRTRKQLKWVEGGTPGDFQLEVTDGITLNWERVDPFNMYWAPHCSTTEDGYVIERHQLTRASIESLLGVEGYDDDAIKGVLDDYGRNGLQNWLYIDSAKAEAEGKSQSMMMANPDNTIDALQFWGSVQGKLLIEWGMKEAEIPDPLRDYPCEIWQIGTWVIKAQLNPDPMGRKPYFKTSYEEIPGSWMGNGVCDLVRDAQAMCNAAARALANNMGIASGPQVQVLADRMADGEDVTQMHPWKIWQMKSDPYANNSVDPIKFFSPTSNANELMGIYEKFSVLADEYSGVPRYMTGDSPAGGAGRTASGMSMLMGNAGKSVKQVIGNIDVRVTQKLIDRLYYYNMRYSEDKELKGDVRVVARGVNVLVAKEQAQVRMNEILGIVATNPMFVEIVGEEAIADLLREVVKPLNMNIVPPKEVIRARALEKRQMQMLQNQLMMQMSGMPQPGQAPGQKVMPGNKQQLTDGAPITDNFAPQRR